ncbi:hypothetical protein CMI37_24320 [Candidatus Pacearchaeota archaeon]|jgi:hypothetical protein|nr:hypothetical protein [Candidatus Pacearchaeota archaeon]|tara:strand:- start:4781 stop:5494 length:714 start_codon:yes stop_codon:yes gene_type:complete
MKIAVLTSLFGSQNDLRSLNVWEREYNVDYYAFLDREHKDSLGWNQIMCPEFTTHTEWSHRRNAKIYKILPNLFLPDYDIHIWIDSCQTVIKDPHIICEEILKDSDIALFKHSDRNCVYNEAQKVNELKVDTPKSVDRQTEYLKLKNFPENNGLYELACFVRRNNEATNQMGLMWWEMICRFSSRDQISFPYVLWKLKDKIKISILPGFVNHHGANDYFQYNEIHRSLIEDWRNKIS